jgi:hypothetical protein
MSTSNVSGYEPGHPWYYVLGGSVLSPKQILARVQKSGYRGYAREQIAEADARCEPRRTQELRELRSVAIANLRRDHSGYRHAVFALRTKASPQLECQDVHVAVSLKHNHLYNEFAHLVPLDALLSRQPDLFEF